MDNLQAFIDRQLGNICRYSYDNVLKRLIVNSEESFYGLQNSNVAVNFDQDPPIFACRFAEATGYEHILALANEDGRVALQDTSKINNAHTLEGFQSHNNAVFDLAWMPGTMNFVTVSGDHTACLWDVHEGSPQRVSVFSSHTRSVKTAVFRPVEPSVFATGARDGHILVWDIRAGGRPSVVLKPDNCLSNCHSRITSKTPGSHSKRDNIRATSITGLVFRDDATLVSCGECDGGIKAWDLRKNYNIYKREPLPKHSIPYCGSSAKNGYTNLIIDDARTRLYASCMDSVIYCFNISTYNALPERRYIGHDNGTFYIKAGLSPDGRYLVSGSSDRNAYLWNVRGSKPVVRLVGHGAEVTCAAWCRRGDTKIVTCSDDARHKLWRIGEEYRDRDRETELKGHAEAVPGADVRSPPRWGAPENTPKSGRRRRAEGPAPGSQGAKRARVESGVPRNTKRCLLDMMNAARDNDEEPSAKRPRTAEADPSDRSPSERPRDRTTSPGSSGSFAYRDRKHSPKSGPRRSPRKLEITPTKQSSDLEVKIVTFTTPTKNLPNFVLTGAAPHLRLMSPVKKRDATGPDWLTRMVRERRGRGREEESGHRPIKTTEKTPKGKMKTLFKYFNVTDKHPA